MNSCRDEGKCVEGILEIFDMLLATTSRFRELKLQHKEYLCVKAMILLNSSMYPLATASQEAESSRKLTHLLNAVTDALVWVIAKSGISSQQQSVRLANLLMLLSHVRHIRYKPLGTVPGAVGPACAQSFGRMQASLQWI
ncbi:Estrogen receptor beta [Lemmus lemmus]